MVIIKAGNKRWALKGLVVKGRWEMSGRRRGQGHRTGHRGIEIEGWASGGL